MATVLSPLVSSMATIFGAWLRWQLVVAAVVALLAAAGVAVDEALVLLQPARVAPTRMLRAKTGMDRCTFPPLLVGLEHSAVRSVSPPAPPSPVHHIVSCGSLARGCDGVGPLAWRHAH